MAGAKIDLLFGGTTWGLAAVFGGAVGGGAALAGSRTAPGFKVRLPYFSRAIVGKAIVDGKVAAEATFAAMIRDK